MNGDVPVSIGPDLHYACPMLLGGRYRYHGELGQGSHGRVLAARDEAAGGRLCALKCVPAEHAATLSWEFAGLRRVEHPHLVRAEQLLRIETALAPPFALPAGALVLVEALCTGEPAQRALADLSARREVRWWWALWAGEATAAALAALHAEGLVHGDVKPSNVLLDLQTPQVTLVDLGLSRSPGHYDGVVGTPAYAAPETLAGQLSFGGDLFAWGLTLAALLGLDVEGEHTLTGSTPQGHPGHWQQHWQRQLDWVPIAAHLPAALPEALCALLDAVLAPALAARMQDAAQVAERCALLRRAWPAPRPELDGAGPRERARLPTAQSPAAQAARLETLPLSGAAAQACATLQSWLERGAPVVQVLGPPGAGRSRIIRDAAAALQLSQARAGRSITTRVELAAGTWPAPATGPRIVHVHLRSTDAASCAHIQRLRQALQLSAGQTLLLEASAACIDTEATLCLGPLSDRALTALLRQAHPAAAATPATVQAIAKHSGALAGRVCRLLTLAAWHGVPVEAAHLATLVQQQGADAAGSWPAQPADARPWSERVPALCGGAATEATPALDIEALAVVLALCGGAVPLPALCHRASVHSLEARGDAVRSQGALHLRTPLVQALWQALSQRERQDITAALWAGWRAQDWPTPASVALHLHVAESAWQAATTLTRDWPAALEQNAAQAEPLHAAALLALERMKQQGSTGAACIPLAQLLLQVVFIGWRSAGAYTQALDWLKAMPVAWQNAPEVQLLGSEILRRQGALQEAQAALDAIQTAPEVPADQATQSGPVTPA
ncbi:MAG: protein kinase domain-containing protein, partial [Polyangiales bacterium]